MNCKSTLCLVLVLAQICSMTAHLPKVCASVTSSKSNVNFDFTMQCLNDGTPEVRDAAFAALTAVAKVCVLS